MDAETDHISKLEEALKNLKVGDLIRISYDPLLDLGRLGSKFSIGTYLGNDDEIQKIKFEKPLLDAKSLVLKYEIEIPYRMIHGIEKLVPEKIF